MNNIIVLYIISIDLAKTNPMTSIPLYCLSQNGGQLSTSPLRLNLTLKDMSLGSIQV